MKKYTLPITVLLLAAVPALGQIYEYIDKHGNRVITDSPPPGAQVREKKISEQGVYWSNQSYEPAREKEDKTGSSGTTGETTKKTYNRVNVVMYMTDW